MRTIFGASAAFAVALATSTIAIPATESAGKTVIHIKDFKYKPTPVHVRVGERVHFVNDDDEAHTVTAKDKSFDSEGLDTGKSWDHVFTKPGTYAYFCELHPYMKATVLVTK